MERPWLLTMAWRDLAFLHWPVDPALLAPHLPRGLALDTLGGRAWLGVVPFSMAQVRPRFSPREEAFLELNLRTYVTAGGVPGVWFFSLDATSPLAVRGARALFHLPYFDARMKAGPRGDRWRYESVRTHRGAPAGEFAGEYRPAGPVFRAPPGTLEHWLTERYWLYSADRAGRVYRGRVEHHPWPLQPAEARVERCTLADPLGVRLEGEPVAHFARSLPVRAWPLERVSV